MATGRAFLAATFAALLIASIAEADPDPYQEQKQELHTRINNQSVKNELQALTPLTDAQAIERFVGYATNTTALTDFRLSGEEDGTPMPSGTSALTPDTLDVFVQVFDYPVTSPSADGLRDSLLGKMSRGQLWRLIDSLLATGEFRTAQRVMAQFLGDEPTGEVADALSLVSAQTTLYATAGSDPQFQVFLTQALQSANSDVAAQAQLLNEAVNGPVTTFNGLTLSYQIWKTVFHDLNYREKATAQIAAMMPGIMTIFENIEQSSDPQRLTKMAQTLQMATEAGFQHEDRDMIEWSFQQAQAFSLENSSAGLAPRYGKAYFDFANGDYASASIEFTNVFESLVQCDIAADAGVMLAECYIRSEDLATAMAALELVPTRYPGRTYPIQKAQFLKSLLDARADM